MMNPVFIKNFPWMKRIEGIKKVFFIPVIFMIVGLSLLTTACVSPARQEATDTSAPDITVFTPTPGPTSTATRRPSITPTFTVTLTRHPTHTPTITPAISKNMVIFWDHHGGDGIDIVEYYRSAGLPILVLYEDGQLICQRSDSVYETVLSPDEMTRLLDQIRATGFMEIPHENLISERGPYDFPPDFVMRDSIGSQYFRIILDEKEQQVEVYNEYRDYLIPEIAELYQIITGYFPAGMKIYTPLQAVLWIEDYEGQDWYYITPMPARPWPENLPPISELGEGHIIVSSDMLPVLQELYNGSLTGLIVSSDGKEYYTALRPLLPNESPSSSWDN